MYRRSFLTWVVAHGDGEHAVRACHRDRGARGVRHGQSREARDSDGEMHAHPSPSYSHRPTVVAVRTPVV